MRTLNERAQEAARATLVKLASSINSVRMACLVGTGEHVGEVVEGVEGLDGDEFEATRARIISAVRTKEREAWPRRVASEGEIWRMVYTPVDRKEQGTDVLVVARAGERWHKRERAGVEMVATALGIVVEHGEREGEIARQRGLDELVAEVAGRLMEADLASRQSTLEWVVQVLGEYLGADVAFLRRNDHHNRVSILEAEWPTGRWKEEGDDPLGVVRFDSDPIFAITENQREPFFLGGNEESEIYRERIMSGAGVSTVAGASVPLLLGESTWGILAFLHFCEHTWGYEELRALQAIASMLIQLQGRFDAEERILVAANTDELTGLANRRGLLAKMKSLLDDAHPITVSIIDLDRFKIMNDFLGHTCGDSLLVEMASRIRTVADGRFVARLGGDEFVVVGIDSDEGELAFGEALGDVIREPVLIEGQAVASTASIGVVKSVPGESPTELLGRADIAMYAAKSRGRNQAVLYDDDLAELVSERSYTELLLSEAKSRGELRVFYQPEVDLVSGELLGVEALVRWEHPTRGLLAAGGFIALAEEMGIVSEIGRFVFEEACEQLAKWTRDYPDRGFVVRVNMSPADFRRADLSTFVKSCIETYRVDPHRLCVEITEYTVTSEEDSVAKVLDEFTQLGIEVAIDDFGTGFSSLSELKRLPVDHLKLDIGFVKGINSDRFDRAIVESICLLASSLGLGVIGEGIESEEIAQGLLELGCRRGQGWLISKALPAGELDGLIERGGVGPELFDRGAASV